MISVGFIGLGLMGSGMSANLLKAGFPVTVWNRTATKATPLVMAGARVAKSPREVAASSDIIVDIVTDAKDVEEVLLGPEGVVHGAKKGTLVIDMSTISPVRTRDIAANLEKAGLRMLDAPVSGGDLGARNGTLSIMVGGDARDLEEAMPIFRAMGKTITHIGGHGDGQVAKAVNQILVGMNVLGVAEALVFAKKAGVDPRKAFDAVVGGAAGSWQLTNNGAKMLAGDIEPGFRVRDYLKDLRIIMETGDVVGMPLFGTGVVQQMFRAVYSDGLMEKGTQAVVVAVEKMAKTKLP